MKSFTTAIALASIVPAIVSLTINTPSSVVQCQPQLISWADGTPPYYLSVIPGGQPGAAPLKTFETQSGNQLTWKVDLRGGTAITMSVKDATGTVAYSDIVTIQQGSDSSCLSGSGGPPPPSLAAQDVSVGTPNGSTSGTPNGTVAVTGTTRPTSIASGATPTRAASLGSASPSGVTQSVSRTTTSARAAATSSSGAESILKGNNYGFVGVVGLIGALFL
ncbi:hypothetical protein BYT27DRAFT_7190743 [Phlegmacium glaucopus]|nr:hypothetical protein BYT27DRAFT_7190743 [Phlegmacium glaucopus]